MSKSEQDNSGPAGNAGPPEIGPGTSVEDILSALNKLPDSQFAEVTRGLQSQAQARRDANPPILVESAIDLPADLQEAVAARVVEVFHLDHPTLVFQVDKNHVGGLKLTVGDEVFDGTTRTRFENFERQLRGQNIS